MEDVTTRNAFAQHLAEKGWGGSTEYQHYVENPDGSVKKHGIMYQKSPEPTILHTFYLYQDHAEITTQNPCINCLQQYRMIWYNDPTIFDIVDELS